MICLKFSGLAFGWLFSLIAVSPVLAATVKIGFIGGFTGSDNNTAKELYRGVEVFFAQHPEAKNWLEIVKLDKASSIAKTVEARQILQKQGVRVITGVASQLVKSEIKPIVMMTYKNGEYRLAK